LVIHAEDLLRHLPSIACVNVNVYGDGAVEINHHLKIPRGETIT